MTKTTLAKFLACAIVALGAVSLAHAQTASAADPSGTYTWAGRGGRGGGGAGRGGGGTNTLVLKYDSAAKTLSGSLTQPARRGRRGGGGGGGGMDTNAAPPPAPAPTVTQISNAKWDAATSTVSFDVTMTGRGGNETTIPYTGKLADGKITGTYTPPARGGGDATPVDWTATKEP